MTADLTAAVRAEAAKAARSTHAKLFPDASTEYVWLAVVDAVASVLAAHERERLLAAEDATALPDAERWARAQPEAVQRLGMAVLMAEYDQRGADRDRIAAEKIKLRTRLVELHQENERLREERDSARAGAELRGQQRDRMLMEKDQWHDSARVAEARVEVLTEALDTAIEALGWTEGFIGVPWPKAYRIEPLRAALAGESTPEEQP